MSTKYRPIEKNPYKLEEFKKVTGGPGGALVQYKLTVSFKRLWWTKELVFIGYTDAWRTFPKGDIVGSEKSRILNEMLETKIGGY